MALPADSRTTLGNGPDVECTASTPARSLEHVFAAELLVHALSVHRPQDTGRAPTGAPSSRLRVLIADDYVDSAQSLAILLSNAGACTEIAMDGKQALTRASTWRPHVCVLDIGMPRLDGCELARRIREQSWDEQPLLIALSGWTQPEHRRIALEAGFDHFIMKPAEALKLARIIQTHFADSAGVSARTCSGRLEDVSDG